MKKKCSKCKKTKLIKELIGEIKRKGYGMVAVVNVLEK